VFKEVIEAAEIGPYRDQRLVKTYISAEEDRANLAFEKLK